MSGNTKENSKTITVHANVNLPTLWCDSFALAVRDDDMIYIRFMSALPEGNYEQTRIMTNKKAIMRFIDQMCLHLNYYPSKPDKYEASH